MRRIALHPADTSSADVGRTSRDWPALPKLAIGTGCLDPKKLSLISRLDYQFLQMAVENELRQLSGRRETKRRSSGYCHLAPLLSIWKMAEADGAGGADAVRRPSRSHQEADDQARQLFDDKSKARVAVV